MATPKPAGQVRNGGVLSLFTGLFFFREVAIKYFETDLEKAEFHVERRQLARSDCELNYTLVVFE